MNSMKKSSGGNQSFPISQTRMNNFQQSSSNGNSSPMKSSIALSDIVNHSMSKNMSTTSPVNQNYPSSYPQSPFSASSNNGNPSRPANSIGTPGVSFASPSTQQHPTTSQQDNSRNLGNTLSSVASAVAAAHKLSKLQARKQKQTNMVETVNNRKDPSSFLMNPSHREESNHPSTAATAYHYSQSSSPHHHPSNYNETTKIKEIEDNFKNEKKNFLMKLSEENALLLQLLEDIQESKELMINKIKELEITRDTLKSLKSSNSLDMIDHYLIDECPLSDSNRYELNLSSEKTLESQKIYERLLSLSTIFKSNYSSLSDYIIEQFNSISTLFMNNQYKEMNEQIIKLEEILLLNPNNIEAVYSLSKSIEKSLIHATSNHLSNDFLKKNINTLSVTKLKKDAVGGSTASMNGAALPSSPSSVTPPMNSNFKEAQPTAMVSGEVGGQKPGQLPSQMNGNSGAGDGFSEAKTDNVNSFSEDEIKQILLQNENLKSTVTQLRQRLAQVIPTFRRFFLLLTPLSRRFVLLQQVIFMRKEILSQRLINLEEVVVGTIFL
jgi:hypothetical protein